VTLPEIAVRRPVTVAMLTVALAVFGWLSAWRLPVELLPDLSYPSLTIQTGYPDAAPVSVEQFVTRPVEEAVGVIPGVRDMRSTSRAGLSEVVLEFEWDEEMDFAALDVREKLGLVELPREAEPPRVLRYDPALDPVVRLALSGERPLDELRELAERWIKRRFEAVDGVAAARVRGGLAPEIQVAVDEERLAALGLDISELAAALRAENVDRPGGNLRDRGAVYLVRTSHEFDDLDEVRRTVVREGPEGRVRVEDVARVRRGHRDRQEIVRAGGREVVELALHREGSANTLAVAGAIREELGRLRGELPADLRVEELTDQSRYIASAVGEVWSAAILGGALAVLVLYFFLRDPGATGIIALSIPVSTVVTFLPMAQAGVSLNLMSLGGLALGSGMLVDNSIVVLEAIARRRADGMPRDRAAMIGAGEVGGAVTASTLTTLAVFVPVVFVRGVAGQLFYDLAVTVCLSLLASLLVALTVVPSLAARGPARVAPASDGAPPAGTFRLGGLALLPVGDGRSRGSRVATALLFPLRFVLLLAGLAGGAAWWIVSRGFALATRPLALAYERLERAYPRWTAAALRRRWTVISLALLLFLLSLAVVPSLGTALVPDLSQGEFAFRLELPAGTPLDSAAAVAEQIEAPFVSDARFARVFSVVGGVPSSASGRQTLGEHLGQIDFVLAGTGRADEEAAAVARVREALARFPAVDAELAHPSALSIRPPVEVQVFSDDLAELEAAAAEVEAALRLVPAVADVATSVEPGSPEIRVAIDRERAAALGLDAETIGSSLRSQIHGDVVGLFREGEERLDIRLRASEAARSRADTVERLRVRLPGGGTVPASAVADIEIERGPAAIHRAGGARVALVTGRAPAARLGETLDEVRARLAALRLPPGTSVELSGQDVELKLSLDSLIVALALALFLVYAVMAVQFESFRYPLVILLSVPLGTSGVVAALLVTRTAVGVLALMGLIMLAGIVVNNAIVLVDAVQRRRAEGQPVDAALVDAGHERLRPILMTTGTTVLGLLPLALGLGAGGELRAPLAVTVIGGLCASTALTLIVIPCVYRAFHGAPRAARAAAPDAVGEVAR